MREDERQIIAGRRQHIDLRQRYASRQKFFRPFRMNYFTAPDPASLLRTMNGLKPSEKNRITTAVAAWLHTAPFPLLPTRSANQNRWTSEFGSERLRAE